MISAKKKFLLVVFPPILVNVFFSKLLDRAQGKLYDYFIKFGKVTDCQIMRERDTGKSRGFGFVAFDSDEAVIKILEHPKEHNIDHKRVFFIPKVGVT